MEMGKASPWLRLSILQHLLDAGYTPDKSENFLGDLKILVEYVSEDTEINADLIEGLSDPEVKLSEDEPTSETSVAGPNPYL